MKFDSSIPKPERLPFKEAVKETPDRTANAWLPLLIELVAGVGTFLAIGAIAWGAGWPARSVLIGSGVVMSVVLAFWLWRQYEDDLLWTVEKITGHDLDHDGAIGEPSTVTHFELATGPASFKMGQVNVDPALLIAWCDAAWNRQSLAYSAWEPRFALQDGTHGRERYQAFRSWLVKEGYAEEVGGNIGLRIRWRNPEAVAFVGSFASTRPEDGTPLLDGDHQIRAPRTATHTRIEGENDED